MKKTLQDFSLKWFLAGLAAALAIAAICLVVFFQLPIPARTDRPDSLAAMKKVGEVEDLIRSRYIEKVDPGAQTDHMLWGLVAGLGDAYAEYYTKEQYEEVKRQNAGVMKGIGISISQSTETGELVVLYVVEESPAEAAGVQDGDILLAVNEVSMEGKTSSEAAQVIQGIDGPITLQLRREGSAEPVELTMEKAEIRSVAVTGEMLEDQIGYIQIRTFNKLTPEQFRESYTTLQEDGMRALIIDLRDNLGGLVSSCCETADQILPAGVIVYEEDRNGRQWQQESKEDTPIEIPLVILVNGYTASSSEIFTGAVRDYGLCTIVGEQTYGKGVEQNTYLLSDGSALKLTTMVYYTPHHEDINGVGITPDVVVEMPEDAEADVQLERALEILRSK